MSDEAVHALEALRVEGRRVTTARRLVIELLACTSEHLTAQEIADRIRTAHPEVHLSTVYRTLESLGGWGLVTHVHQPHGPSFFHLVGAHHHLVCEDCGRVRDVPSHELDALIAHLRDRYDFDLHIGHAAIVGRCREH
jgi:Fur family transcriptional regulator, ferric uptake regulator